jgi:hypothetical protein
MRTLKINYFYIRTITMTRLLTIVLISMFLVITFSGCQEETSSATGRKTKLVQNENFRLNNVIKEKDAEIAALKAEIVERDKKIEKITSDAATAADKFIEIMRAKQKMNLEVK